MRVGERVSRKWGWRSHSLVSNVLNFLLSPTCCLIGNRKCNPTGIVRNYTEMQEQITATQNCTTAKAIWHTIPSYSACMLEDEIYLCTTTLQFPIHILLVQFYQLRARNAAIFIWGRGSREIDKVVKLLIKYFRVISVTKLPWTSMQIFALLGLMTLLVFN